MSCENKTPIDLEFELDAETKNTVRFEEQAEKEDKIMGKVYVKKDQLAKWGDPKSLVITVRPK